MKESTKEFLRIFWSAGVGVAGLAASLAFVIAVAPTPWLLIGITGMIGSVFLTVSGIYNGCAEVHLMRRKDGPNSSLNYRKGLRKLKRRRAAAVRKLYSMKAYSSNPAYYLEVIEVEKEIAKHMGIDYVKPTYLPKDRWSSV